VKHVDVWIDEVFGQCSVQVYWRPFGYPFWLSLGEAAFCATPGGETRRFSRIRFGPTKAECSADETEEVVKEAEFIEYCIEFTGHMRIQQVLFAATLRNETHTIACKVDSTCRKLEVQADHGGVEIDEFDYEVTG